LFGRNGFELRKISSKSIHFFLQSLPTFLFFLQNLPLSSPLLVAKSPSNYSSIPSSPLHLFIARAKDAALPFALIAFPSSRQKATAKRDIRFRMRSLLSSTEQ
jgi:hypothetical protein